MPIPPLERLRECITDTRNDEAKIALTHLRRERERLRLARVALREIISLSQEVRLHGWKFKSGLPARDGITVRYGLIEVDPTAIRAAMAKGDEIITWPRIDIRLAPGKTPSGPRGDITAEGRVDRVILGGINMSLEYAAEKFMQHLVGLLDAHGPARKADKRLRRLG